MRLNWTQRMRGHGQIGRHGPCPVHGTCPRPALKINLGCPHGLGILKIHQSREPVRTNGESPFVQLREHTNWESVFCRESLPIERSFLNEATNWKRPFFKSDLAIEGAFRDEKTPCNTHRNTLCNTWQHRLYCTAIRTRVWGMGYGVATTVAQ